MLRYVGLGKRHYGEHPMPPHPRLNWEFLTATEGKICPIEESDSKRKPVENTLWLYPPGVVHGWMGERDKSCELVVLHYSALPPAVEKLTKIYGHLQARLEKRERAKLRRIGQMLKTHYWHPTLESEIFAQRALMDLCLLILRPYKERHQPESIGGNYERVVQAEEWLRARLSDSPSVKDAARAVGLSVSHLYRLFQRIRKESPQETLTRIRIEHAMTLLGSSNAKLQKIAAECGFSSASNLCRAFRTVKGRTPSDWRRETFIQYKRASKGAASDHTQHGRRRRDVL